MTVQPDRSAVARNVDEAALGARWWRTDAARKGVKNATTTMAVYMVAGIHRYSHAADRQPADVLWLEGALATPLLA